MPKWNEFETFVAPGKAEGETLRFSVSEEFIAKHLEYNRYSPVFQTSTHIYGRLPEINLISMVRDAEPTPELTTLDDAVACFEGIKRPHADENYGESVLIYVLHPKVTIERTTSMACMARAVVPPKSFALTALIRTNEGLRDVDGPLDGSLTRLEWVIADENGLPKQHETRYAVRHWAKQ